VSLYEVFIGYLQNFGLYSWQRLNHNQVRPVELDATAHLVSIIQKRPVRKRAKGNSLFTEVLRELDRSSGHKMAQTIMGHEISERAKKYSALFATRSNL